MDVPISSTRDEVKENQLNGGFEMPNCHSTKTALCNEVHVVSHYVVSHIHCVIFLKIYCERESKGNAWLSFLDARAKTTPTEPFLT